MKRFKIALTGILLLLIINTNVWAEEIAPAFSSVEYLSANDAAVKVSEMMEIPQKDALNLIKEAQSKIPSNDTGLLSTSATPAFIYSHLDIGKQSYLEIGAVVMVIHKGGASKISEVISSYCRPVNHSLKWTPSNKLTVTVQDKTQLRFSVEGETFIKSEPVSEDSKAAIIEDFAGLGFTPTLDGSGFTKQIAVTSNFDLNKASGLSEKDIGEAYITMLTYFQEQAKTSFKDRSKVAIDLQTPVGLTEQGQKIFFDHLAKLSGGELIETDEITFHASWDPQKEESTLADCLLTIKSVSIVQNKILFGISGMMGEGEYYGLPSNEMKRNTKGVLEVVIPEKIVMMIS